MSKCGSISSQAEGSGVFQQTPWQYQQVRTRKRGTEYQPKNIKRKRTHGWIKRLSSQGGIEVLLRRMLKGRKSLSHWRFPLEKLQDFQETHVNWKAKNLNIWLTRNTGCGFGLAFLCFNKWEIENWLFHKQAVVTLCYKQTTWSFTVICDVLVLISVSWYDSLLLLLVWIKSVGAETKHFF